MFSSYFIKFLKYESLLNFMLNDFHCDLHPEPNTNNTSLLILVVSGRVIEQFVYL